MGWFTVGNWQDALSGHQRVAFNSPKYCISEAAELIVSTLLSSKQIALLYSIDFYLNAPEVFEEWIAQPRFRTYLFEFNETVANYLRKTLPTSTRPRHCDNFMNIQHPLLIIISCNCVFMQFIAVEPSPSGNQWTISAIRMKCEINEYALFRLFQLMRNRAV